MSRGLVLGCGGTVGGAWTMAALDRVQRELDWDARTADVIIGTSSGATIAAMLGAGISVPEMLAAQRDSADARPAVRRFCTRPPASLPRVPLGRPASLRLTRAGIRDRAVLTALSGLAPNGRSDTTFLDALVDDLAPAGGWVDHPATWIVAADLETGERVPFGADTAPTASLRDAVRASWAVPGWFPPVTINGRGYLDGGIASPASPDLLAGRGLTEVVVIAPMASVDNAAVPGVGGWFEGLLRRPMSRILDAEVALLRAAGTRVVRVHPTGWELFAMGPNFMRRGRRLAALTAGLSLTTGRRENADARLP